MLTLMAILAQRLSANFWIFNGFMCGSLPVLMYVYMPFISFWCVRVSPVCKYVNCECVFGVQCFNKTKEVLYSHITVNTAETWCWSIQANGFDTLPHTNTQLKSKHKRNRFSYFLHIQTIRFFFIFVSFFHYSILLLAVSRPIHVTWLISMSRVKDRILCVGEHHRCDRLLPYLYGTHATTLPKTFNVHLYTGEYARQNQHEKMIQWQSKSTNFIMFHVYLGCWVFFSIPFSISQYQMNSDENVERKKIKNLNFSICGNFFCDLQAQQHIRDKKRKASVWYLFLFQKTSITFSSETWSLAFTYSVIHFVSVFFRSFSVLVSHIYSYRPSMCSIYVYMYVYGAGMHYQKHKGFCVWARYCIKLYWKCTAWKTQ